MKLLAIDTALGACSAAVLDDSRVLARRWEAMERGHAERLAPMVREGMDESGIGFDALDRIAVTVGPGTFTGQRVGYAFARGLRLALKIPLIGVTTLAAMAREAMAESAAASAAVLHDAKRGEVYFSLLANGEMVVPEQIVLFGDAIVALSDRRDKTLALAGTAAAAARDALALRGFSALETNIIAPDAVWVGRIARTAPVPQSVPRPLYLRPPDARLPAGTS